jgi:hypothetical protein
MGGMSRTTKTLAHPHNINIANSQFQLLILSITLRCAWYPFDKVLLSTDGSIGGLFLLVNGFYVIDYGCNDEYFSNTSDCGLQEVMLIGSF